MKNLHASLTIFSVIRMETENTIVEEITAKKMMKITHLNINK